MKSHELCDKEKFFGDGVKDYQNYLAEKLIMSLVLEEISDIKSEYKERMKHYVERV